MGTCTEFQHCKNESPERSWSLWIKHPWIEQLHGWVPAAAKSSLPARQLGGKSRGIGRSHPEVPKQRRNTPQSLGKDTCSQVMTYRDLHIESAHGLAWMKSGFSHFASKKTHCTRKTLYRALPFLVLVLPTARKLQGRAVVCSVPHRTCFSTNTALLCISVF